MGDVAEHRAPGRVAQIPQSHSDLVVIAGALHGEMIHAMTPPHTHWGAPDVPEGYARAVAVSQATLARAQSAKAVIDALLARTVTPAVVMEWLKPVNFASRNPQSPQDFALRCTAIAEMVGGMPAAAFTVESRRLLPSGFFPSWEDVRSVVDPIARHWRHQSKTLGLMHLLGEGGDAADRPAADTLSPEQRQSMVDGLKALHGELVARAAEREADGPAPVKALPLSGEQLAEARRRAGIQVAPVP